MISIVKPPKAPAILMTRGVEQTKKDKASYDQHPHAYHSGKQTFDADKRIYGHKSVKNALIQAQHHKCCYCESRFLPTSDGDVEHYRPKGAVKQARESDKIHPGYYWLAYCWDNLLVSCSTCNRRYKGVLFPLSDNSVRSRNHHDDIGKEQPLFVNPAIDDPRNHICFHGPEPQPKTEIGRETIEGLGLRRPHLQEERLIRFQELSLLCESVDRLRESTDSDSQALVKRMKEHLAEAVLPNAKYSAMAQDFLNSIPSA